MEYSGNQQTGDKIQKVIASLLSEDKRSEAPLLQWFAQILETEPISSFLQLAENSTYFMQFSSLTKLHLAIPAGEKFIDSPDVVSFVSLLSEIWKAKRGVQIFSFFDEYLHGQLNPNFTFESDFESLLYSHSQMMVHIVIIVALLSTFVIDQAEEEEVAIFGKLGELSHETQDFLEDEFKDVVALYEEISAQFQQEPEIASELFATNDLERTRKGTTINDMHLFKKIEEQENLIETLQDKVIESEKSHLILKVEFDKQNKELEEKTREVQKLTFSRDDLLEKLKSKRLEFVNDIVEEKDLEIQNLKDRLEQHISISQAKARDLQDDNENLHKKIHQLENYKIELDDLKSKGVQQNREVARENNQHYKDEIQNLREKITKLQEANLADKEKCLNFEMTISKLNIELHGLTIAKQNLEFRVKELESLGDNFQNSDVFLDDYDEIARELSSTAEIQRTTEGLAQRAQMISGDSTSPENQQDLLNFLASEETQKHIGLHFQNYERKCLSQIKTLLTQLKETRDELAEVAKDANEVKSENEELNEKVNQLENSVVEKMIEKSPQIQDLLRQMGNSNKEGSEIAQDLLKTILKREQEINRLKSNRKRLNNEIINVEGRSLENINVIYTVIEAFFGS